MPGRLGDAFVGISPDLKGFGASLSAKVRTALKGINPVIAVGADTRKAQAQLAALEAELKSAGFSLPVGLDVHGVPAALARLRQLIANSGVADLMDVNVPQAKVRSQLILLKRLVQQAGLSDLLDVNLNEAQLLTQLKKLGHLSETIPVNFDVGAGPSQALGDIAELRAQAAALLARSIELRADVDAKPALAALLGLQATFAAIGKSLDRSSLGDAAVLRLQARLLSAEGSLDALAATAGRADAPIGLLSSAAGIAGGLFGLLGTKVQLFGGALTAVGVPAILATAGGVHILTDAAVEFAAVIVPASVALGAFGVAAIPTIQAISTKMQAVYTTSTALGQSIYPLTGQFSAMAQAVQPEVYQLFGEALVVAQHDTGLLTTIAVAAGKALDTLGARAAVALTSGGLGTFLAQGPADLAKIGDIIGNIFGTIGNLLRVMPGYAQVLLSALDGLTKGLEAVTGSPIGQWLIGATLAFHGFILWGGLAATAAVAVGNALVGLAAKFGLAEAGAVAFDAAQFVQGILTAGVGVADLGVALVTMAGGEAAAAAGSRVLAGAMAALDAVNPLVWVGLAAAALGGLVFWLTRATDATDAFGKAQQAALEAAPLNSASTDIIAAQAAAQQHLTAAVTAYNTAAAPYQAMLEAGGRAGQAASTALSGYASAVSSARADVAQSNHDYANFNALLTVAHGNVSFLADANLSLNQILAASPAVLKQYAAQVQAAEDAQNALGLGTGRAAAAQNAQTNEWLTSTIPAMQKVISAEDSLLSAITGGRTAFNDFQQSIQGTTAKFVSPSGLADAATLAKGNLSGLSDQSLAFSNVLYTQSIPALQKTIDALELQGISQGDLTKVVATGAGEILQYTGNNKEARSVVVDLINNALGPGKVSLQGLNKWVAQNSTTLGGFNSIVATSTVNAGNLANTLKGLLNPQFQQDILDATHASTALKTYTQDLVDNTQGTAQGKSDRQQLITDLENSGFSAKQAKDYVDGLQKSVDDLHGKQFTIDMNGQGLFTITGPGIKASQGPGGSGNAAGGLAAGGIIRMGTGPTADDVLVRVSKGETVVSARDSKKLAPAFKALGVPGYAAGGAISGNLTPGFITGMSDTFTADMTSAMVTAMRAALKAAEATAAAKAAAVAGGKVANGATITAALTSLGVRGVELADALRIIQLESGGSLTAKNPGSNAYGIAQFINGPSEYYQYGGNPNTVAGQITAYVNYVHQRYGTFANALAFRLANGYYGKGGLIPGYAAGGLLGPLTGGPPPIFGGLGGGLAGQVNAAAGFPGLAGVAGFGLTAANAGICNCPATTAASSAGGGGTDTTGGGGTVSPGPSPVPVPVLTAAQKAAIAALRKKLAAGQSVEARDYAALVKAYATALPHAKPGSYLAGHRKSLAGELATLAKRQAAEAAAYKMTAGTGLTAARMSALASRLRAEASTAHDTYLSTGEPGPAGALRSALGTLATITGTKIPVAAVAKNIVPGGAAGGLLMDGGGWLVPGWNPPILNNTGRPERVTPAGPAGPSADTLAIIAELRALGARVENLTGVAAAIPGRTGDHVGAAVSGAAAGAQWRARYPGVGG